MRILFLSQLIPHPLDAGPKVRSYYVLRHLAAAGHEVTLLAFSRESDTAASVAHLREFCAVHSVPMVRSRWRDAYHAARSLPAGIPFLIARDHVPAMMSKVKELAAPGAFDAIHADQLWMAPYALAARASAGAPLPRLVVDQHNAVFLIPQRLAESGRGAAAGWLLRREARLMRRYEQETCRRFDEVVWVSAEDCAAVGLPEPPAGPRSRLIPICVDPWGAPALRRAANARRVTFLGGLHWPPNAAGIRWFVRDVWPRVRAAVPDAVLTVIGKSPPGDLWRDSQAFDGIEVTGYVDDPAPYLAETAVFIVPLHAGGGMRVKILDAWVWGLPVVSTSIGAEGINDLSGGELLLADSPAEFAAAVTRVMRDPELAARLAAAGRRKVEERYNWLVEYKAWDEVYAPALTDTPQPELIP